ncbi:hypothetical protein [Flavobacterium sp. MK4S-17]|uniref:hypothetical protein n=1 Tax=Flavobacterium sp. MK4S-17 TaxID=2543737 RepID=UPI00135C176C|nr:hypothetical protein [Flavobacterium sp. MK4S-17]
MACKKEHSHTDTIVEELPIDQGGVGRHKCASCAYEAGYKYGLLRAENINLESILDNIEESQKGQRRHRSPHAAYSLGYYHGVLDSYQS